MDHHAFKLRRSVAALIMSATLAPAALLAQSADEVSDAADAAVDETPSLWFVELDGRSGVEGASASALATQKADFRRAAAAANLEYEERYSYGALWNGLSLRINPDHVTKLARLPGVRAVYPVVKFSHPGPTANAGTDLATAIQQTGADIAQNSLGLTGKGVKVAVMDTGIDYDHPDLGGCFGPGCRVATGWDFVGNEFNADDTSPSYNPVATPDPFPDDCNGHGTHVAGIVGANGAVKGVAPEVTFGAYRVFGCEGSTTAEIMIAAMERALADGMDVLNMSIGSAYQWPQYPTAVAASRLVQQGMVVVASIGNSGANGLYSAGAPGLGEEVIGVASFDNTHVLLPAFTISPDNTEIGYSSATAAAPTPTSGSFPMSRTGTTASTGDACNAPIGTPPAAGSLAGTVALIRRGGCSFHEKAANAQAAGAAGVVLYNNTVGFINPTVAGAVDITIPVVAITAEQGALIDSRLASGSVTMTWTDGDVTLPNPTGNLISSFSSYGLSPDLALKPDIGAPGGSINSTYVLEQAPYANISGTSMASPHVAGSAALLLQAHPGVKAKNVRDILQNSADPKLWWGNPALGHLDNVHRQGAGMVDVDDAIQATTYIKPGKLSLGEGQAGPVSREITVSNNGKTAVTYNLSYENALSTSGVITASTSPIAAHVSDATVAFSTPSITVDGGFGVATFTATITPATGPVNGQYGGYIVLTPTDGGRVYRVPFAGFVGDYQSIRVLTPTANGFPWLARVVGTSLVNQPTGGTFTLEGGDIPYFVVHFDHQVRRFVMRVTEIVTNPDGSKSKGRDWYNIVDEEYLGRNSTPSTFFTFTWDGQTFFGNGKRRQTISVPDGEYVVTLEALKALGNPGNPAHTETWESPIVTIDRP